VASDEAERQLNKRAELHLFLPEKLVILDEHSFLAKNQKLAPKWSGPHKILRLKGKYNIELLLWHDNKKLVTHVNRLKPYFVPKSAVVTSPDFFPAEKPATPLQWLCKKMQLKIFSPMMTSTLWTWRSLILTLPLLVPSCCRNKILVDTVQHRRHHLSMVTLQRSVFLTLPLHLLQHMRKLLLAPASIFLHHLQLLCISPFQKTALLGALALALARACSHLSVPRSTCRKFPSTCFQF
jgi:hypothetical protein